jgi:hypothetical protein
MVKFYRKYANVIVGLWKEEVLAAGSPDRKLVLIYLANDVLQNSRRKGLEMAKEFSTAFTDVLPEVYKSVDSTIQGKIARVLNIWQERSVFDVTYINKLKGLCGVSLEVAVSSSVAVSATSKTETVSGSAPKPGLSAAVLPPHKYISGNLDTLKDDFDEKFQKFLLKESQLKVIMTELDQKNMNLTSEQLKEAQQGLSGLQENAKHIKDHLLSLAADIDKKILTYTSYSKICSQIMSANEYQQQKKQHEFPPKLLSHISTTAVAPTTTGDSVSPSTIPTPDVSRDPRKRPRVELSEPESPAFGERPIQAVQPSNGDADEEEYDPFAE